MRVGSRFRAFAAAVLAAVALAGCQATAPKHSQEAGLAPDSEWEVARTWRHALVYLPSGQAVRETTVGSPPAAGQLDADRWRSAVVYLHGCDGFAGGARASLWRRLARAGVLVVMPDSFARTGRVAECGRQTAWVYAARIAELEHALEQLTLRHRFAPSRIYVLGHSEGAVALARHSGRGFAGAVITGYGCRRFALEVPTLAVLSRHDEKLLGRYCRSADEVVLLDGDLHDPLTLAAGADAVVAFLRAGGAMD